MPLYQTRDDRFAVVNQTSFEKENILERKHLQAMLKNDIGIIVPDAMVLSEEYGDWEDSRRRIDLLCLDKNGCLVIVELKRTEDGGHMDLQAIRYAAMVSKMTYTEAVKAHQAYKGGTEQEAEGVIKTFLGWDESQMEEFANDVRIVLAGAEFSKEITTAVMWLRERDIDICCMKLEPHHLDGKVLVNVQKIIPLPEAEAYQIKIRTKEKEEREIRESSSRIKFDLRIGVEAHESLSKIELVYQVVKETLKKGFKPFDPVILKDISKASWVVIEGKHDKDSFIAAAESGRRIGGSSTKPIRFFHTDSDRLFYIDGKTYALSNDQWGKNSLPIVDDLIAGCGLDHVSYNEAGEAG